jgi:predicted protein tyrosine phosphatase
VIQKIVVLPEFEMGRFHPDEPYAVISITDRQPYDDPAYIPKSEHTQGVLRLEFMDFDPVRTCFRDNRWQGEPVSSWVMQPADAQLVWRFLERYRDVPLLVIHCHAGASRSPSMAMAVCDGLGLPRNAILWHHRRVQAADGPPPNQHVYNMTLSAAPTSEDEFETADERIVKWDKEQTRHLRERLGLTNGTSYA